MAKAFAKPFYNSKAWTKSRNAYIDHRVAIDGGLCEQCHDNIGYIVHHRIELTPENIGDVNISLAWSNFKYLCKDCHDTHEGHGLNKAKPVEFLFDKDGQLVPFVRTPP